MKMHKAKKPILSLTILASVLALSSTASFGYFEVKDTKSDPQSQGASATNGVELPKGYTLLANRRVKNLVEYGSRVGDGNVGGFGKDVPLDVAVEMLIPDQWVAYVSPQVDVTRKVTWEQGHTWADTLEQIGRETNTVMVLDWNNRVLRVDPQTEETARSRHDSAESKVGAAVASASPVTGARAVMPVPAVISIEEFLSQPVNVDLRAATVEDALKAMLPPDWTVDAVQGVEKIKNMRIDLTIEGDPRSAALAALQMHTGLLVYPYPQFRKVVVTEQPQ